MTTDPFDSTSDTTTEPEPYTIDETTPGPDEPLEKSGQTAGRVTDKERLWAVLAHVAYVVVPILGPVLILAFQKNLIGQESSFISHHTKQAAFWQLIAFGAGIITFGLATVVMAIWTIIALMAAYRGELYRFPLIGKWAEGV